MTNFIRDIGEDVLERDRIYMPIEDLKKFSVSEKDIFEKRYISKKDIFEKSFNNYFIKWLYDFENWCKRERTSGTY